ncbi:MAG TPA: FAD-binding oxidoreductase [Caldisericia bacterium]|nr:FAD-binding oxidoreductase [Caldisericia bacterium]HPF49752.1 FAD-binding oxidoreductase [Caldisericia bacterium]HPI84314.1 FAD-binding oxidoreductase [Caldisericia bacterium]HPQ93741.1 FAD-binding oxidoreductase [Caldisericia bacterium]HRV74835.1 FAD-binding oxidoreductase [Caldisericia bacterium]
MNTKKMFEEVQALGLAAVATPFETRFYGFDVTPLPAEAYWAIRGTRPQVVTRPKTTEEVSRLLAWATKSGVPVTPRGGGTSGYFQSVPRKRGVVIETLELNQVGEVDKTNHTVRVGAGAIWSKIEFELNKYGYCLKTYPTSYRSSTVAGWMQTEGYGIGSIAYGHIKSLIHEVEAVLPSGEVVTVKKGKSAKASNGSVIEFDDFFHSEGMLSFITSVVLEVRPQPEMTKTHLLLFKDHAHFAAHTETISTLKGIYFIEFVNGAYMDLLVQSGFHAPEHTTENISVVIRLEGTKQDVGVGSEHIKALLATDKEITELPEEDAEHEYGERLDYFRVKAAFSSVTPADISVPTSNLKEFLDNTLKLRFKLALKGEILTPTLTGIMFFMVLGNELSFVRFMSTAPYQMEIILRALKYGGAPNGGVGLLNTPYVYSLRTKEVRDAFVEKKESLDEAWVLNPGKWTDPPFFLRPSIYFTAMKCLEPVCWLTGGIRRRW